MKRCGDQTEIVLLRPCVITPAFNYADIRRGRGRDRHKLTESDRVPACFSQTSGQHQADIKMHLSRLRECAEKIVLGGGGR